MATIDGMTGGRRWRVVEANGPICVGAPMAPEPLAVVDPRDITLVIEALRAYAARGPNGGPNAR